MTLAWEPRDITINGEGLGLELPQQKVNGKECYSGCNGLSLFSAKFYQFFLLFFLSFLTKLYHSIRLLSTCTWRPWSCVIINKLSTFREVHNFVFEHLQFEYVEVSIDIYKKSENPRRLYLVSTLKTAKKANIWPLHDKTNTS